MVKTYKSYSSSENVICISVVDILYNLFRYLMSGISATKAINSVHVKFSELVYVFNTLNYFADFNTYDRFQRHCDG